IDVDAARDHHVALAVAQEQVTVRVEVADVADADEAVASGFGARLGLAVIIKIRHRNLPHEDFAGFVDAARPAVGTEYLDDAAFDRAADSAGLCQRLLGRMPPRYSGFGRAEIFVDDRSPPFDHGALDLR